jgi:hypothetical protein
MASSTRLRTFKWLSLAVIFVLLVLAGFTIVYRESIRHYRQSTFVEAALRGNVLRMRLLLAAGANIDQPACESFLCPPPIVAAAFNERSDGVRLLLDRGANVNGRMQRGQTALMIAAYQGRVDTVKLLLSRGADVNAESQGNTALEGAKQKSRSDIVEMLVNAGASR